MGEGFIAGSVERRRWWLIAREEGIDIVIFLAALFLLHQGPDATVDMSAVLMYVALVCRNSLSGLTSKTSLRPRMQGSETSQVCIRRIGSGHRSTMAVVRHITVLIDGYPQACEPRRP